MPKTATAAPALTNPAGLHGRAPAHAGRTPDTGAIHVAPETLADARGEMTTAVQGIVQLFIDRCPEGFNAIDVADSVVDACSDELDDLYHARAQRDALAERAETLRVRLWRIEQTLQRIDAGNDPAGLVGDLAPHLDGPIHPSHIAAYRAAQEA
ncbi:hypothetical protein [Kitasatospora sp. NPDC054795]